MKYVAALFWASVRSYLIKHFDENVWDLLFFVFFFATIRIFFLHFCRNFNIFKKKHWADFYKKVSMKKPASLLCTCILR